MTLKTVLYHSALLPNIISCCDVIVTIQIMYDILMCMYTEQTQLHQKLLVVVVEVVGQLPAQ